MNDVPPPPPEVPEVTEPPTVEPVEPRSDIQSVFDDAQSMAIADNAAGYAAYSVMPEDSTVLTTEFKMNLLAPGRGDQLIARAEVTYMEGYLWDKEAAKNAFLKAARAAHSAGKQVALSLSDPFCVDRHRDSFLDLIAGHIDILFANEEEIKALYRTGTFEAALDEVRGHCKIAAITRGPRASVVLQGDATHEIAVPPVAHVVDTTGAGDLFAAGFLYGYTRGKPVELCARIGSACAAEIISHIGARPEADLAGLIPTA